jgi:uncharacterized protein
MKSSSIIIFYSVFTIVYGLVNFYIFKRGLQAIPQDSHLRIYYIIIFLVLVLPFILGRFLEGAAVCKVSDVLIWIGSFWLAAMAYFFLSVLLLDILRLLNYFFGIFPAFITENYAKAKMITFYSISGIVCIALIAGFINARTINIKNLDISIRKKVTGMKNLNIALISDIHLGTIIGKNQFEKIVDKINSLQPDVVLFAGDMVDENIKPVIEENLGESFLKVKSKDGIYAVTGNHEYIGGVEKACKYLTEHGIKILRDSVVKIFDEIYIIGREDRSAGAFGTGKRRKPLSELVKDLDKSLPIIMMDHQPFNLNEAVENGIDLQLSGHTHHGQIWPFNYITNAIYEVSWGYLQKGNTHFYVSSGVGSWGPPIRLANRPEIVNVRITFE